MIVKEKVKHNCTISYKSPIDYYNLVVMYKDKLIECVHDITGNTTSVFVYYLYSLGHKRIVLNIDYDLDDISKLQIKNNLNNIIIEMFYTNNLVIKYYDIGFSLQEYNFNKKYILIC